MTDDLGRRLTRIATEHLQAFERPYGTSADDLTDAIEQLDAATVARAATACRDLRAAYASTRVAGLLLAVLDELGTAKL